MNLYNTPLGEIRKSGELGYKGNNYEKWIWASCLDCGKERWVPYRRGKPESIKCPSCAQKGKHPSMATRAKMSRLAMGKYVAEKNANWKGGRTKDSYGYILCKLSPDDFFYPMANRKGYVGEHRLVMAKHLGRNLHRWEIAHHKNHIKEDNRIGNLQLVSDDRHLQITILENRITSLEKRITILEAENILLKGTRADEFIQYADSD